MDVVTSCPLRAAAILWRSEAGAWVLTVVCKATYVLSPAESPLAPEQDAPNEVDSYWDDDESRSVDAASDLAPFKLGADVLLVGHAYAPKGSRVRSLVARMIVGEIDKSIEVFADRAWTPEGALREGPPFERMPLRWERAAGAPGTDNPVGVRPDAPPDRYGMRALPNLQRPGARPPRPGQPIEAIGFGPIAPTWPTRAAWLHRHAATWSHAGWYSRPLPDDVDGRYFNTAPPDQQPAALRGDERILLSNLHPEHPQLATRLLRVTPRAEVTRDGEAPEEIALRCDTLIIDTDRGRCSLLWRAQVALWHPSEAGQLLIWMEQEDRKTLSDPELTLPGTPAPQRPALPFSAELHDSPAPALVRAPVRGGLGAVMLGKTLQLDSSFPGAPEPAPLPEPRPALDSLLADTEDMEPEGWSSTSTLPFASPPAPAAHSTPFPTPAPPAPWTAFDPGGAIPTEAAPPTPPAPPKIGLFAQVEAPPPPALEGPANAESRPTSTAGPAPHSPEHPESPRPEAPAEVPELPLNEYPIARCAAIAASIARRRPDQAGILEENKLTPPLWAALASHWSEALDAEAARGRTALLEAYDRAYVGRLEEERGPIRTVEYARLVVAMERGRSNEVLAELTLPAGARMRIQRVWLRRIGEDAALGRAVAAAIEAAREAE